MRRRSEGEGVGALTGYSFQVFIERELHGDVRDPEKAGEEASEECADTLRPINSQGCV